MNNKSYDRITERIVSLLSQGTVTGHGSNRKIIIMPRCFMNWCMRPAMRKG